MSNIHKETFTFLIELIAHNERDWFADNKDRYEKARENVIDFAADVLAGLSKADPLISKDIDPKKCVMRIYRDVRFSKNKAPYKSNFGIGFSQEGKHNGGIGYYVHIQPGECFTGGGYWMPEAAHLKAIRQEIDYNASELKKIIDEKSFKMAFGDFRNQEQLKTVPRDYNAENENIALLKLKSFAAAHKMSDAGLQKKTASESVIEYLTMARPLNVFLAKATSA